MNKEQLDNILVDVRKAYRLLYLYQRRIMDTISFVGTCLSKNVEFGRSIFSNNAPKNYANLNLNRWAWDWLNMYCYEFNFGQTKIKDNEYQFAVIVISDSGWDDAEDGVKQTEVERFVFVEQSFSRIYFVLGKNLWDLDKFEDDLWYKESNNEFVYISEDKKQIFLSKRFNVSEFIDETAIRNCVESFKALCITNELGDYFK